MPGLPPARESPTSAVGGYAIQLPAASITSSGYLPPKAGDTFKIVVATGVARGGTQTIRPGRGERYVVTRNDAGGFTVKKE